MPKLIFRTGQFAGKSIGLPDGKSLVLGRNRDIDLPLPDLKLSRRHCEISNISGRCGVKDLNSTNGTYLNGERLGPIMCELKDHDRIVLGDTDIEFEADLAEMLVTGPGVDISNMATPAPNALQGLGDLISGPSAQAPFAAPPPTVPFPAQSSDPREVQLQAALRELALPLPPEPPPLQAAAQAPKPKFLFCDACNGSVPGLDVDLGTAKEIEGKLVCKDCLAKGVHIRLATPAAPAPLQTGPSHAAPLPVHRPPPKPVASVDNMLAGLEDEAVVVDTTLKRRGVEMRDSEVMKAIDQFEKTTATSGGRVGAAGENKARQAQVATPPAPPAQNTKPPAEDPLGDEFEEIG